VAEAYPRQQNAEPIIKRSCGDLMLFVKRFCGRHARLKQHPISPNGSARQD
jgi:hypothetical protein